MTHLRQGDKDLHDENGEHISTPPSTRGSALAAYQERITKHLHDHETVQATGGMLRGEWVGNPKPTLEQWMQEVAMDLETGRHVTLQRRVVDAQWTALLIAALLWEDSLVPGTTTAAEDACEGLKAALRPFARPVTHKPADGP